jgi:hypothetical protein
MTNDEQNIYKSKEYAEAMRYMDNAKEALKKAEKEDDGYYKDVKYVRTACGMANLGVLRAFDTWLAINGLLISGKKLQKFITPYDDYKIAQIDEGMLSYWNTACNILYLGGYYRKEKNVNAIEGGFDAAYRIIDKIKPEKPVDVPETRGDKVKRAWNKMMISLAVTFRF